MGSHVRSARRLAVLAAALIAMMGIQPRLARAQSASAKRRARQHFAQGEAYMKTHAYDLAAKEYEAAYEAVPRAGFQFNVGLAYEKAGDAGAAIAAYTRYLGLEPDGVASAEARARRAALQRAVAAEEKAAADAARARAEAAERRARGAKHAAAARRFAAAGDAAGAIGELRAAFEIDADPAHVYAIAEAYRREGDRAHAIVEYERYRQLAPTGAHAAEAIETIARLRAELDRGVRPVVRAPAAATAVRAKPGRSKRRGAHRGRRAWTWIALGAATIAAGVAADTVPGSARDGTLSATDFVPLGLYGVGAVFVFAGVF